LSFVPHIRFPCCSANDLSGLVSLPSAGVLGLQFLPQAPLCPASSFTPISSLPLMKRNFNPPLHCLLSVRFCSFDISSGQNAPRFALFLVFAYSISSHPVDSISGLSFRAACLFHGRKGDSSRVLYVDFSDHRGLFNAIA